MKAIIAITALALAIPSVANAETEDVDAIERDIERCTSWLRDVNGVRARKARREYLERCFVMRGWTRSAARDEAESIMPPIGGRA